jgi:hypothetical protein
VGGVGAPPSGAHMTPGRVSWGSTPMPVSDKVIDQFESLELIYREHRADIPLCQLRRIGSVAQQAQRAV